MGGDSSGFLTPTWGAAAVRKPSLPESPRRENDGKMREVGGGQTSGSQPHGQDSDGVEGIGLEAGDKQARFTRRRRWRCRSGTVCGTGPPGRELAWGCGAGGERRADYMCEGLCAFARLEAERQAGS